MDVNNCIPKHKLDFEAIELLKTLDKEALRKIIPDLIEWLQDTNWPISKPVSELLLQFNSELIPFIKDILSSNDSIWKYSVLKMIVAEMSYNEKMTLKADLTNLAENPNGSDKEEEVDMLALKLLSSLSSNDTK